jgi:osmotically-inducible protein OsmY
MNSKQTPARTPSDGNGTSNGAHHNPERWIEDDVRSARTDPSFPETASLRDGRLQLDIDSRTRGGAQDGRSSDPRTPTGRSPDPRSSSGYMGPTHPNASQGGNDPRSRPMERGLRERTMMSQDERSESSRGYGAERSQEGRDYGDGGYGLGMSEGARDIGRSANAWHANGGNGGGGRMTQSREPGQESDRGYYAGQGYGESRGGFIPGQRGGREGDFGEGHDPRDATSAFGYGSSARSSWQGQSFETRGSAFPIRANATGSGPKGYTRSDERVLEEVCDRLEASGHDWSEVEVKIADGEITLSGTVTERSMKYEAEQRADGVRGVLDVINQIRVKKAGASPSAQAASQAAGPQAPQSAAAPAASAPAPGTSASPRSKS